MYHSRTRSVAPTAAIQEIIWFNRLTASYASPHGKFLKTCTSSLSSRNLSSLRAPTIKRRRRYVELEAICGKEGPYQEFIQLIQYDTIYSDWLLTRTTYSSTGGIPETVLAAGN